MALRNAWISALPLIPLILGLSTRADAATFGLPRYVEPETSILGAETELNLDHGAGIGFNLKFDHGLSELAHVGGIIGTGNGHRRFRIGGQAGFDIFPDAAGQVGLGLGTQAIYYRMREGRGQLELTAVPYLHKTFHSHEEGKEFDPFVAFPWGFAFGSDRTDALASLSVGSSFKLSERFRWIAEFTIAIQNTDTLISGGVILVLP